VKNSLREIELLMFENWPECAETMPSTLLKIVGIQAMFKKQVETCVEAHQLQHADFSVLAALRRSPIPYCLSPTELYQSMLFSSGGLTKVLRRLLDAGLIERLANPDDKRSKLVKLNEKGKLLAETIMPKLHQQDKILLAGLTVSETAQLDALLQKLLAHHEKD